LNDSIQATQGVVNNLAGQALNNAASLTQAATGGRLQQDLQTATQTIAQDTATLTNDATQLATGAANVASDLATQFANNANGFIGGLSGANTNSRLQEGNLNADIAALNQAALNTLTDTETAFNDATTQTQALFNNALTSTENALGNTGAAVQNPARLQQDATSDITQDTTAVSNDLSALIQDGIGITNDVTQQANQAFSNLVSSLSGSSANPNGDVRTQLNTQRIRRRGRRG
jgi:hypothetical protein